MTNTYDLAIVGAGSAGLAAAEFAVELGVSVALIEKNKVGGDCTWYSCIPSKALLAAAEDLSRSGKGRGTEELFSEAMSRVHRARNQVYESLSPEVLKQMGIEVIQGAARFRDPHSIEVGNRRIIARKILIATGAVPFVPPIPGMDSVPYISHLDLFDLEKLPDRLLICGGGPVGVEMAQAFSRLGSRVTIVEAAERVLPGEEPEASELVASSLSDDGVEIHASTRASAVSIEGGVIRLEAGEVVLLGDTLLCALGRIPNTAGLGLEAAGIAFGEKEGIAADRFLRTGRNHIFASGDVTGGYMFTHVAAYEALIAVRNALLPGHTAVVYDSVPWATFTSPEVARVGMSEAQARGAFGDAVETSVLPMSKVDRALAAGRDSGFVKVIRKKGVLTSKVLGATVVGERAGELIQEWVYALEGKLSVGNIAGTLHVYPTYSVANQQTALEIQAGVYLKGWKKGVIRALLRVGR